MDAAPIKCLLAADELAVRVSELGQELSTHYTNTPVTVLGVMTGGLVFCADLVRQLSIPLHLGVLHARSYSGTVSGDLKIWSETLPPVVGRDVLIVDDIFDTGQTLRRVVDEVAALGAKSVRSIVLLQKDVPRTIDYTPDWIAFDIPDEFVVGYGLDFNGEYRQLPYVGILPPHLYES